VPIDDRPRRNVTHEATGIDIELETNKPGNVFVPGETMFLRVINRSNQPVYIELVGTSSHGKKAVLTPSPTRIAAGGQSRFPEVGGFKARLEPGKEQITVYASLMPFSPGTLTQSPDGGDRVVHSFDPRNHDVKPAVPNSDPARAVEKTIEIETRPVGSGSLQGLSTPPFGSGR